MVPTPKPAQNPAEGPAVLQIKPLTKQDILKPDSEYSLGLRNLIQNQVRQESDREHTRVYSKIRRNNLYYRGMQFLTLVRSPDGSTVDYRPIQGGMSPATHELGSDRDEMYDNILPLFRGDVRKWCGVLGVRAPNAKCQPRTAGDDHQIRLSRIGDRALSYLRNVWQADEMQRYLAYSLAVNGTTFGFVQYVSDASRYGETEIPKLEVVQVPVGNPYFECWKCGSESPVMQVQQTGRCTVCDAPLGPESYREPETAPSIQVTGTMKYANGAVEMQMATPATVKTPYYITSDLSRCPWLWYEYLANRYELIRAYAPAPDPNDRSPDAQFRREMREFLLQDRTTDTFGTATQEVRRTQNTLSSPSGFPYERKTLANFGQYFLSPGMLEAIPDDQSGNIREQLIANYPKGVWALYTNGKLLDIRKGCISDHWSVCQPDVGEFIYRDAAFDDYIQGVDVTNDCLNMLIQQAEKSIPLTFFDPDVVDSDHLRDMHQQVGEFLEAKRGVGSQLSQSFFRTPVAQLDAALQQFMDFYIQKTRENVGILPALYGGGEADEAVGVAKIRRNQSLMQLNIPWNYMRDFWSETYANGMRLLAQYANGKLVTAKGGSPEIEELEGLWELSNGGWVVQCEEAMPMSWAQRQERIDELMQRPNAWPLIGLVEAPPGQAAVPDNLEQLQEDIGLPDWTVPGLAAKERMLDIIDRLLRAEPMDQPPPPPDPMQPPGPPQPPPPPHPSVQPDQTMFDGPFAVQVCRAWLVSDKGRDAEQGVIPGLSPRGFENVLAYTKAWMDIVNTPPPPPPQDPPKVSLSVKVPDLLMPGGPQAIQAFENGQIPPPPPPMIPGPPPMMGGGAQGGPPQGPPPPDSRQLANAPPPPGANMATPPSNGMPMGPAPSTLQ